MVLGGSGFIGSHVVRRIVDSQFEVISYDKYDRSSHLPESYVHEVRGDFLDRRELEAAIRQHEPEVAVHLVWSTVPKTSNDDPQFDVRTNLEASLFLLDLCVKYKVRKLVFMSSGGAVYGLPRYLPIDERHPTDPISSYGITKLALEKYAALYHRLHGIEYVCLRAANPYGPGQSPTSGQGAIAAFAFRLLRGEPIELWGDGEVVRDFFSVLDLADLVVGAVRQGAVGVFNAGSGRGTTLNEIIAALASASGTAPIVKRFPPRQFDAPAVVLDAGAARRTFGWQPRIGMAEGLQGVLDWMRRRK